MRNSTKQSRKSTNAQRITAMHADVKRQKQTAATLFRLAQESLQTAREITAGIKALAKEQVVLKQELKGPPRAPRAKKADSRVVEVTRADTVGDHKPGLALVASQRFAAIDPGNQLDNIAPAVADGIGGA